MLFDLGDLSYFVGYVWGVFYFIVVVGVFWFDMVELLLCLCVYVVVVDWFYVDILVDLEVEVGDLLWVGVLWLCV